MAAPRSFMTCFWLTASAVGLVVAYVAWLAVSHPPWGSDGPWSAWRAGVAGDVDRDGRPDLWLATPFEDRFGGWGFLRVLSCGAPGASPRFLHELVEVDMQSFGASAFVPAGDLDGDGGADFLLEGSHGLRAVSGADLRTLWAVPCDLSQLRVCVPPPPRDADVLRGGSLAKREDDDALAKRSLGDAQRSSLLLGGVPCAAAGTCNVSLVDGATGSVRWTISGPVSDRPGELGFGWYGAAIGDVDADDVGDVAVSAARDRLSIRSGRDGRELRALAHGGLRRSFALGDLDHDGGVELLLEPGDGASVVVDVKTGVTRLFVLTPLGASVAACGDVDGDGCDDFAVGRSDGFEPLRVVSGRDGRTLVERAGVGFDGGACDFDRDGTFELVATRNVVGDDSDLADEEIGDDELGLAGTLLVLSARDLSTVASYDAAALGL